MIPIVDDVFAESNWHMKVEPEVIQQFHILKECSEQLLVWQRQPEQWQFEGWAFVLVSISLNALLWEVEFLSDVQYSMPAMVLV